MKKKILMIMLAGILVSAHWSVCPVYATDEIEEIDEVEEVEEDSGTSDVEGTEGTSEDYLDVDDYDPEVYETEPVDPALVEPGVAPPAVESDPTEIVVNPEEIKYDMTLRDMTFDLYLKQGVNKFEAFYTADSAEPRLIFTTPDGNKVLTSGASEYADYLVTRSNYQVEGYPDIRYMIVYLKNDDMPGYWRVRYQIDQRTDETILVQAETPEDWLTLINDYKTSVTNIVTWGLDENRSKLVMDDIPKIVAGESAPSSNYIEPSVDPALVEEKQETPFRAISYIIIAAIAIAIGIAVYLIIKLSKKQDENKVRTVKRYNARMKKKRMAENERLDQYLDQYDDAYQDEEYDDDDVVGFEDEYQNIEEDMKRDPEGYPSKDEYDEDEPPVPRKMKKVANAAGKQPVKGNKPVTKKAPPEETPKKKGLLGPKKPSAEQPVKKAPAAKAPVKPVPKQAAAAGAAGSAPVKRVVKPTAQTAPGDKKAQVSQQRPVQKPSQRPAPGTPAVRQPAPEGKQLVRKSPEPVRKAPVKKEIPEEPREVMVDLDDIDEDDYFARSLGAPRTERPVAGHKVDEEAITRENAAARQAYEKRRQERTVLSHEEEESLKRPAGKVAKEVLRERPAEKRSFDYTNESKDQPGWMDKRKNIETDDAEWKKKAIYEEIKDRPFF